MGRFYGKVGFLTTSQTSLDVATPVITEFFYKGDIISSGKRWEEAEGFNENLVVTNRISLIADDYAFKNIPFIRFVNLDGTNWKVTNVTLQHPRLILSLGGVYNGPD